MTYRSRSSTSGKGNRQSHCSQLPLENMLIVDGPRWMSPGLAPSVPGMDASECVTWTKIGKVEPGTFGWNEVLEVVPNMIVVVGDVRWC